MRLARSLAGALNSPAVEQEHPAPLPVSSSSTVEEGIVASVEKKIRERAYQLWIEEGQPDGRADHHWEAAARLVEEEKAGPAPEATPPAEPQPEAYGPAATAASRPRTRRKPAPGKSGS